MKISIRTFIILFVSALGLGILAFEFDWLTKLLVVATLLGGIGYLALKFDYQQQRVQELNHLRAGYEQLDQQAKLIVRTDLELHRTQEELDHKLASLFALHELGRQLRVNLQPEEIYGQLNAQLISGFGFSRALVGVCRAPEELRWQSLVGIEEPAAEQVRRHLLDRGALRELLSRPDPKTIRLGAAAPADQPLLELLSARTVVVAGVSPQAGPQGLLVLIREGAGAAEGRGDEELIAVLATQLAIAVENSALYEEAWGARRELEQKVHERTQELASANEQLIRLNKSKSDFVSAVSHELRTPLAAIKGYASLLRSGQFGELAKPQAERLAKIEKHTDLLTQLINNLLDIARIESGRVTMESRPIEAEELMATVVEMIKPQVDAKRIALKTRLDGVRQLVGDPTHLPRVFMNLLSNAVKYTPEGGSIAVHLERAGGQVIASVQDSGCGISPEELPKLFQEFYRSGNPINEQVRGTGLGLALAKRIVEAHHGRITVTSHVGKGTTFTFTLPASPVEQAPA
ncbi:MAG: hypothetical protein HYY91_02170 [Candidatus Omnitrophica bacterium]|nr:hypothetical protein [Candidatus Omnitrophota bacterium]